MKSFVGARGQMAVVFLIVAVAAPVHAQVPKKKLLCIGTSKGYQHDSTGHAMATLWKLGQESGLWDTFIRTDTELLTKKRRAGGYNVKNLDDFDAVYFFTTGELDMDAEQKAALLAFVHDEGKGFIGQHSATDTFYEWPEYGEMIGGYFDDHPWHRTVRLRVEDREFPATKHLPESLEMFEEIYQFKNWSRDKCRVLISLDTTSVDLTNPIVRRTDQDFALAWVKKYGKGRVFYNALGHRTEVIDRPELQQFMLEGVKWAMGLTEGDVTPHAKPE